MAIPVKRAPLLLLCLGALLLAGVARADEPAERLQRVLADAARAAGGRVILDPALQAAASRIAQEALDGGAGSSVHRQVLWSEGIRDARFEPITLVAESLPPDAALAGLLASSGLDWSALSHGGAGVRRDGDRVAATFLLVQRSAVFGPKTVQLPTGSSDARLIVTNPLGQVGRRDLKPTGAGDTFARDEAIQALPGTWLFELERGGPTQTELLAVWTVDGSSVTAAPSPSSVDELGLGPAGLGASEESLTSSEGLAWVRGAEEPPSRAPRSTDAEEAEGHLRAILSARRRAAGLTRLEVHAGATTVARARSAGALAGEGDSRPPQARLLDAGITPLAAEEVVAVATDPTLAWALLMSEQPTRELILRPGLAQVGIGGSILSTGGAWQIGVTLLRAEIGDADATWPSVVRAHLRRAREEAGLGDLYPRERLDALAKEAAAEIAQRGIASMPEARRRKLIEQTRAVVPDSVSVGIDVLVTRDPGAVTSRAHVTEARFAEVGVGVVEVPTGDAGFAIVLVLVQR